MKLSQVAQKIRDLPYLYLSVITLAVMESDSALAQASGNTIGGIAQGLTNQIQSVGKLAVGGSFLAGVGMVGMGLLKLKQAADTQGQQVKYGEGMWRLAVGAGLVAVPAVTGTLTQSMNLGGVNIQNFNGF